ncbi:MAG: HAD-IA family hydrolase [Proteobacteria bacterium]|nr:HAD-IA family hydrolase [Pseudomonadota bacterium]
MSSPARLRDGPFDAVLFDLDGTLVDTAPDMVAVLQAMQAEHGVHPVTYPEGRMQVSNGALGLLRLGFPGIDVEYGGDLHLEYLDRYAGELCAASRVFAGLDELLETLDAAERRWGVVTNKPGRLTRPLLDSLGLASRSACIVSGDSLPVRKPDPAPLLLACDMAGIEPRRAIYVGDAARDIEAGLRAGLGTIAAGYGYITDDDDPRGWGADVIAPDTSELARIVLEAVNLGA